MVERLTPGGPSSGREAGEGPDGRRVRRSEEGGDGERQRMTRLAPYTELVNSGAVRASLMEAGRPILYLHGHIHTDPVEVLSVPGGDALVCISAPAAEDGFNIIEVVFTRSGKPLHIPWPTVPLRRCARKPAAHQSARAPS